MTDKQKAKLAIHKQKGGKFAVVDYSNPTKTFSKVLTKKEEKALEVTGKLPVGVTAINSDYSVIAVFDSYKDAAEFKETGKTRTPVAKGIFKSLAQAKKAKQLAKK